MKKFYKTIIAFITIFLLGLFITYLVINSKLNNDKAQEVSSTIPISLLETTTEVVSITF